RDATVTGSSDVCSSDLINLIGRLPPVKNIQAGAALDKGAFQENSGRMTLSTWSANGAKLVGHRSRSRCRSLISAAIRSFSVVVKIGRASCRERSWRLVD